MYGEKVAAVSIWDEFRRKKLLVKKKRQPLLVLLLRLHHYSKTDYNLIENEL